MKILIEYQGCKEVINYFPVKKSDYAKLYFEGLNKILELKHTINKSKNIYHCLLFEDNSNKTPIPADNYKLRISK